MTTSDMQRWGKKIIDHPAIRNKTDDIQLIMTIVGYNFLGVRELINNFDLTLDPYYMVVNGTLNEQELKKSIDFFNRKYGNILEYLNRFYYKELQDIIIAIVNLCEEEGLNKEMFNLSLMKDLKKDIEKLLK